VPGPMARSASPSPSLTRGRVEQRLAEWEFPQATARLQRYPGTCVRVSTFDTRAVGVCGRIASSCPPLFLGFPPLSRTSNGPTLKSPSRVSGDLVGTISPSHLKGCSKTRSDERVLLLQDFRSYISQALLDEGSPRRRRIARLFFADPVEHVRTIDPE
jgi:hypothetical protein